MLESSSFKKYSWVVAVVLVLIVIQTTRSHKNPPAFDRASDSTSLKK